MPKNPATHPKPKSKSKSKSSSKSKPPTVADAGRSDREATRLPDVIKAPPARAGEEAEVLGVMWYMLPITMPKLGGSSRAKVPPRFAMPPVSRRYPDLWHYQAKNLRKKMIAFALKPDEVESAARGASTRRVRRDRDALVRRAHFSGARKVEANLGRARVTMLHVDMSDLSADDRASAVSALAHDLFHMPPRTPLLLLIHTKDLAPLTDPPW